MNQILQKLNASVNSIALQIAQKKGVKDRIEDECIEIKNKIDFDITDSKNKREAYLLTLAFISIRRESSIATFEKIGTYGLKALYGDDYKIHFLRNEEKKNAAAFKMEIGVESKFGDDILITGLSDERGGGISESTSVNFRIGALEILSYDGPLLLDETYKSISADQKIENAGKFISGYAKSSGRQIIFVTHKADTFSKYADHVISITKTDGISSVDYD